jgi:hypothetical protein
MRHKTITLLTTLAAALTLTAVATATASAALPEFAPEGGKYPVTFEYTSTTHEGTVSTTAAGKITPTCEGMNVKGSITGAKAATLTVEMKNCKDGEGYECYTGETPGIILSGNASLVYINKATKQVGLVLTQKKIFVNCFGGEGDTIQGAVVIPVTPINTKTSTLTLTANGNGKGAQEDTSYENEKSETVKAHLEWNLGSGYIAAALETGAISATTSKPLTIDG